MMTRTVISKSCLICFVYFLVSCTASSSVPTNTSPEEKASTEINSIDLENIILGTPAPQESKVGGMSGCFSAPTSRPPSAINDSLFYNVFRFYSDGTVVGVKVGIGIESNSIYESWDKIIVWFNRNNDDLPQGTYHIIDNQIWFDMSDTGQMMAEYYYGVFYNNSMTLSSHYQRNGTEKEENVEYLELECAPQ